MKSTLNDLSKSKHLVFVEDNEINQIIFTRLIDGEKVTSHICTDGVCALDYLKSEPEVDFILMDCEMPRMDGYECTKKILELQGGRYNNVPIVAATANESSEQINRCLEAGMLDVLIKPFDKTQLFAMINKYI